MNISSNEVLTLALLAAKAGGNGDGSTDDGGTGWSAAQITLLETVLNALTYANQTAQDSADALIESLRSALPASGNVPPTLSAGAPMMMMSAPAPAVYADSATGLACTAGEAALSFTLVSVTHTGFETQPDKLVITWNAGAMPDAGTVSDLVLKRVGDVWSVYECGYGEPSELTSNAPAVSVTFADGSDGPYLTPTVTLSDAVFAGADESPAFYTVTAYANGWDD